MPFWLSCADVASQVPGETEKKPDYSQEPVVVERAFTKVTFENDGGGARTSQLRVRIQSDAGVLRFGLLRVQYASANDTLEIDYVRVQKPDGTAVETPPENILEAPAEITRLAPVYSDLREKHIAVKALSPGDVLEISYRMKSINPLVPNQFWLEYSFTRDAIVLEEELQVDVPRDRAVKVKSPDVPPAVTDSGSRRLYRWKTSNLEHKPAAEGTEAEENQSKQLPSVQLTSFQSWQEIGRWYAELQRPRARPTPEIQARAAELTRGVPGDEDKLRALYHFVATKHRYVGLSFGIGRLQPHAAAEVLNNQYGDCKDKHTLLASLLQAVGLRAYPALIPSSRELDSEIPSPAQFDHLISVVRRGNELVWLDTTTEVAPFGFLPASLRDKQALVIWDEEPAELVKTPANPPFASFQRFQIDAKLSEEGTLQGKVRGSVRGDLELLLRQALRRTPQANWSDLLQTLSFAWGFGGTVGDVTVSLLEQTEEPLQFSYTYTRKNYSDWGNRRILTPLPFLGFWWEGEQEAATKAKRPFRLGAPGELLYRARVELPSGFRPSLPPAKEVKQDFAEYHATYSLADGVLEVERRVTVKLPEVPASRKEDFQAFRKAIQDDEDTYLAEAAPSATLTDSSNPEAERLFNEGRTAFQQQDIARACDLLEQAVAADPQYSRAWLVLGIVRMGMNEVDLGLEAFHKAIDAAPNAPAAYKPLAFALMSMNRTDEALEVWRKVRALDPGDQDAPANLASALYAQKHYDEAAAELEAAVKLNPRSARLYFLLGQAQLRVGDQEKAFAAFSKAVELEASPLMLNNVAFDLADHNSKLPQALEYAERAVRAKEDETAKIRLDQLGMQDLQRMQLLGGFWDTLGWVHFRLGNLGKAERYLATAWNLLQAPDVADHLAQVYAKQGKKNLAAQAYAWALATGNELQMPETQERLRQLVGSEARLDAMVNRARSEVSLMRTFKLSRLTPKKVSAEFFILFSAGGRVEGVKFISGAEELRATTEVLQAVEYDVVFPDENPAKIVRRGILMCTAGARGCDFVFYPFEGVRPVPEQGMRFSIR